MHLKCLEELLFLVMTLSSSGQYVAEENWKDEQHNKSDRSAISVGWYKSELKDGGWGSEENKCKQYFSGSLTKKRIKTMYW